MSSKQWFDWGCRFVLACPALYLVMAFAVMWWLPVQGGKANIVGLAFVLVAALWALRSYRKQPKGPQRQMALVALGMIGVTGAAILGNTLCHEILIRAAYLPYKMTGGWSHLRGLVDRVLDFASWAHYLQDDIMLFLVIATMLVSTLSYAWTNQLPSVQANESQQSE